jgi:hypothetical protein
MIPMSTGKKYDVRKPEDRKELIDYALNFSPDMLLELHDDMWKKGHRGQVTDLDKKMWYWMPDGEYDRACDSMFEYTCLEADYLKIDKSSHQFHLMCDTNRQLYWGTFIDVALPELQLGIPVNITYPNRDQMMATIRSKWGTKNKLEVKVDER